MTQPPESGEPDDRPDPEAVPGGTSADHPGWGSAPVDPTPPASPTPPPTYPQYPGAQYPGAQPPPPSAQPAWQPPRPGWQGPPPAYGYGHPQQPVAQTSQKAVWALVLGIISLLVVCCYVGFLLGIPAIILGVMGRSEVRASNGWRTGEGMALAGIITGSIGLVLGLAWLVFVIVIGFS